MGLIFVEATLRGPAGTTRSVNFLVDSGASYSLVPYEDWKALGLSPKRSLTFTLGDGTRIKRDISECHVAMGQFDGHAPVILGERGDEPLLGAVTLENLGLVLDPFKRTLQAMQMHLA